MQLRTGLIALGLFLGLATQVKGQDIGSSYSILGPAYTKQGQAGEKCTNRDDVVCMQDGKMSMYVECKDGHFKEGDCPEGTLCYYEGTLAVCKA
ncbi:hypothetical protein H4R20_001790 [Coemansia guatemalensis]|uniref:Carbohydrate-binding module family 19 domain-containing protein n=1 Tax=Coemansia guatemalensis TaxID=2761395 RepID=A0A9W8HYY1_9FUNG|nr:hypothetical protein H4R20_001790 [Coemansia guatemalensis]